MHWHSAHSSAGAFICSGGDRIWLGTLARSLAPSVRVSVLAGALAFNRTNTPFCVVFIGRTVFPLQKFLGTAHAIDRFSPGLLVWIEDVFFG